MRAVVSIAAITVACHSAPSRTPEPAREPARDPWAAGSGSAARDPQVERALVEHRAIVARYCACVDEACRATIQDELVSWAVDQAEVLDRAPGAVMLQLTTSACATARSP